MKIRHVIIFAILSTSMISHAYSQTIELFDASGHQLHKIDKTEIHDGDILKFNDGKTYQVISYVGEGRVNIVFKVRMVPAAQGIPEPLVIKLPKIIELKPGEKTPREQITSFIEGYSPLKEAGVPIPTQFGSLPGQYVASEFIENDFDGHTFFVHPELLEKQYSPQVVQEAEQAMIEFARTTIRFRSIGDFLPGQMVYNIQKKKWILIDWFNAHEISKTRLNKQKADTINEKFEADLTLVCDENGVPISNRALTPREKQILSRMRLAITAARKNLAFNECFYKELKKR
jgi:hypothetical protein